MSLPVFLADGQAVVRNGLKLCLKSSFWWTPVPRPVQGA